MAEGQIHDDGLNIFHFGIMIKLGIDENQEVRGILDENKTNTMRPNRLYQL